MSLYLFYKALKNITALLFFQTISHIGYMWFALLLHCLLDL